LNEGNLLHDVVQFDKLKQPFVAIYLWPLSEVATE